MKPSMQLNLGQQLTLTPQLQQAIKLLQLSTLELQQEIQYQLDNNPLLETEENESSAPEEFQTHEFDLSSDVALQEGSLPKDLPMDHQWEDVYTNQSPKTSNLSTDEFPNFENLCSSQITLQDHLQWQLDLTPFSDSDRDIAAIVLDSIDQEGFLKITDEEILAILNESREEEDFIEMDEVEAVIHRIQRFDPVGVGARNLEECLLVQLLQYPKTTPHIDVAKKIITEYTQLLAQREYKTIMNQLKINKDNLVAALDLVRTLDPKPGHSIVNPEPDYIVPDVLVRKVNGAWQVTLNQQTMPKIRINQHYSGMIASSKNKDDSNFLKNNLQEAKWFIKSLQSRHDTLLRVAKCIIEHQKEFLELGEEAMKPLVLHDIAEALELHESTISRVTTQKYMHTPRGIFELKYFFSSQVSTENGGTCSSTAIRAVIRKLIASENSAKPLSDNKIALLLKEQGINVARRTIAKYRESMNIPSSNERKYLSLDSL